MLEIGYMTALFAAFGIAVLGFVLGSLATFVRWMKSEDSDLKRGYIEIAGNCYRLQPMEDPLLSHRRRISPAADRNVSS
jgi:hypothetical protein